MKTDASPFVAEVESSLRLMAELEFYRHRRPDLLDAADTIARLRAAWESALLEATTAKEEAEYWERLYAEIRAERTAVTALRAAATTVIDFAYKWSMEDGHHEMCTLLDGDDECNCGMDSLRAAMREGD